MALVSTIDDEWSSFLSNTYNNDNSSDDEIINEEELELNETTQQILSNKNTYNQSDLPEPSPIYISTKSKIAYLDKPIDLKIFWDIPVIPYGLPQEGVVKKQIKFNSKTIEELNDIQEKVKDALHCEQHIMTHIDNPSGRIKFKDIRKISIGVSKKDIMSYRSKKKQAFYNCFVMIIRLNIDDLFREFHIKVFNTGKLEIPGVQNDTMFELVLNKILYILQPHCDEILDYKKTSDTVLINSNFNCGFYIDREALYDILKYKYNIQAIYDPCSYPGIQCKFYYNKDGGIQNGIHITKDNKMSFDNVLEVSFMIFRTGSVLIVGMCDEHVLVNIYEFLKNLLRTEFLNICQKLIPLNNPSSKNKKKKVRRKTITVMGETETIHTAIQEKDEEIIIVDVMNKSNPKVKARKRRAKKIETKITDHELSENI